MKRFNVSEQYLSLKNLRQYRNLQKSKVHIVGGKNKRTWIMTLNTFIIKINTYTHTQIKAQQDMQKNVYIDLF